MEIWTVSFLKILLHCWSHINLPRWIRPSCFLQWWPKRDLWCIFSLYLQLLVKQCFLYGLCVCGKQSHTFSLIWISWMKNPLGHYSFQEFMLQAEVDHCVTKWVCTVPNYWDMVAKWLWLLLWQLWDKFKLPCGFIQESAPSQYVPGDMGYRVIGGWMWC